MNSIMMTQEYWRETQLSAAARWGGATLNGIHYIIVNKEGKDLFELSIEADREGREYAIPPGEPADMVDERYLKIYKKIGRDKFIEWVKEGLELKQMKARIKEEKR